VIHTWYDRSEIGSAVRAQLANGRYPCEHIYGDGHSGARIAETLATCTLTIEKRLAY
jgi:GDP/UDP-N,N'-diacetylbacillosamine 2-epimerase (hydrolysing)